MAGEFDILRQHNETVLVEKRDGVALITLNRPAQRNAVNGDLATGLGQALREVEIDDAIQVAVITGAGRAFCAGADLKAVAAGADIGAIGHPEWGFAGIVTHKVEKPVIAAVNGYALGGGTDIVLACDLAVMADDAELGLPEVKRGIFPAGGGLIRLPRQVPVKVAMRAALTGDPIAAEQALRWGLVNEVVPAGQVVDSALELARTIAANAPLAVRAAKEVVRAAVGVGATWDTNVWALNDRRIQSIFNSRDAVEGAAAFAERRPPQWSGS